jgi:hypothetical protein
MNLSKTDIYTTKFELCFTFIQPSDLDWDHLSQASIAHATSRPEVQIKIMTTGGQQKKEL